MTIIVENCTSKTELKAVARALNDKIDLQSQPLFRDPAFINPLKLGEPFKMADFPQGMSFACTNHPKRSWFAVVSRDAAGKFKVE